MFLDVTLVDFDRRGKPGAQGAAGKQGEAVVLEQVRPDTGFQHGWLDQAGDMLVTQSSFQRCIAVALGTPEGRPEVDLRKLQPLFQRMDGAGLVRRSAANLALTPAGFGVEREQGGHQGENSIPVDRLLPQLLGGQSC